jgi:hypothetical protein
MKPIRYTQYMLDRMEFRLIPQSVVAGVLRTAVERYSDNETRRFMAVQRVKYQGHSKHLVVAYEENEHAITTVTVHTVTKRQIQARLKRQRWIPK